mgnify:FL=1
MKRGDIVEANANGCPWWMSDQQGIILSIEEKPKPIYDRRRKKDIQPGSAANVRWLISGHRSNTSISLLDVVMQNSENE